MGIGKGCAALAPGLCVWPKHWVAAERSGYAGLVPAQPTENMRDNGMMDPRNIAQPVANFRSRRSEGEPCGAV